MKRTRHITTTLILLASLSIHSLADEARDESRIWEKYAIHTYSNLNTRLNGDLAPIFRSLGDCGELHKCFDRDRNPEKYEAYRQFLIQVFADAKRGDVGEAMFANVLLELTPTHVLLPLIAPEIGPEGRLQGILDGKYSDVAKKIERRSQVIYQGNVNFDHYVSFLKGRKDRGYTSQTNATIIVEHMFQTQPQRAFVSMLWADYGFLPYSTTPYVHCKKDIHEVRQLQMSYADISDYLYRSHYHMPKYPFPLPSGLEERVRSHLYALAEHNRRWVRLYVAYLLKSERMLRWTDILEKVAKDPDPSIQRVIASINGEDPGFTRRPNKIRISSDP
jgi:hypothetical protein